MRPLVLATAALAGGLLTPASANAHAIHVDVTVADAVTVLAYFSEDIPADDAEVRVTDAAGALVASGKTDDTGVWRFPRPGPGAYTVTVNSVGHVATRTFEVGGPGAEPAAHAGGRPDQAVGLATGLALLLGVSGISWFLSRRRRVR